MGTSGIKLAIFDRFKNGNLTTEAKRRRSIIMVLASSTNPTDRTRIGISQVIAKQQKLVWKNIYSGIFNDIEEILIPSGLVEESGRLPSKRGPKIMQEVGVPFYHLTKKGLLVVLAINDDRKVFSQFLALLELKEREFEPTLTALNRISPKLTRTIFTKYVRSYCDQETKELLPFDLTKLRGIEDEMLDMQREMLEAFVKLSSKDKQGVLKLFNTISGNVD